LKDLLRINLHCHSHFSDGELSPEDLAERLAMSGVRAAALTDHETVQGQAAFRQALTRRSVACLSGLELTVLAGTSSEIHLLGYGFDPSHPALLALLGRPAGQKRQAQRSPLGGPRTADHGPDAAAAAVVPADKAIRAIHEAGGLAFWAHPIGPDAAAGADSIVPLLLSLKDAGLDGLEAFYEPYLPAQQEALAELADRHGLLTSAGGDYHGPTGPGSTLFHVEFPAERWRRLRDALLRQSGEGPVPPDRPVLRRPLPHFRWRSFVLRILMPTLLAVALFAAALFGVFIPSFESRLLERKRDMIRELTNIAFSILAEYETDAQQGRLTLPEAQRAAADRVRNLRYGAEGKDYFWIQDLHPRMIMHPYRTDLEGGDLNTFKDPRGVPIFVEFVRVLSDRPEAYVEYVWQWKDNPDRLAPKQSFIKKFEPWGWIVSTGLYLDDVRTEIRAMAARLIRVALAIAALCGLLLFFVAAQSLRIERIRERAEEELRESHEKYRALVESGTEGTLVVVDGRPAFANSTLLDLLGYRPEELPLLELADLVAGERDMAPGPGAASGTAKLRRRNGQLVDVGLASAKVTFGGREALVLSVRDLGGERRPPSRRDMENQNLIGELQASLLFLHEPIASCAVRPLFCELRQPVGSVAALMTAAEASAAVVLADGEPVGILTDRDIRARLVAEGKGSDRPAVEIMTSPLVTIGQNALVYEAILAMRERSVDHLLVRDENGRVVGILRNRDLLLFHRFSPAVMTQEIRGARSVEAVAEARRPLAKVVGALVEGGAKARNVTRAVTAVSDAAASRLIELAEARFGPPPVRYAFLALGSQGREEQTLATDQDHALILEDYEPALEPAVSSFFAKLGEAVTEGLAQAGYPRCPGKVMTENPRWRQPLRVWAETFDGWLASAEPEDILGLQVFFDFRTVVGDKSLALELRRRIDARLAQEPPFLLHYAQYALQYKIHRPGGRVLNMKDAMMPVVNFARLYAFKNGIPETHTLDRLRALLDIGMIKESLFEEAGQVYDQLMGLRLAHQARCAEKGRPPDNELETAELTQLEETLLRQAFSQMGNLQKKISFDFLGSA